MQKFKDQWLALIGERGVILHDDHLLLKECHVLGSIRSCVRRNESYFFSKRILNCLLNACVDIHTVQSPILARDQCR